MNATKTSESMNWKERIEATRVDLLTYYRKHEFFKKLVFFVCLFLIVFFFMAMPAIWPDGGKALLGVQYGGTIGSTAFMLVYYVLVKKNTDLKMKKFFTEFYKSTNEYVLDNKKIKDIILEEPGKISVEDLCETRLYRNLFEVGSRGLTTFKFNGREMSLVDCAGKEKGSGKIVPVFIGKLLRAESSFKEKSPVIVYLKNKEGQPLPPNNVEDLKVVSDNAAMTIYSNLKDWKKVISEKVIKEIEKIHTNKLLVDLSISVFNGKVSVAMGYDDPLMVPPLEKPLDEKNYEQYKKELSMVFDVVEAID